MLYKTNIDMSYQDSNCSIDGSCSINPGITSAQEFLFLYVKELSFYLLKLKSFGITNEGIKNTLTEILFCIVINVPFTEEQFQKTMYSLSKFIEQSKILYEKFCSENGLKVEAPPVSFKHIKNINLATATINGEKHFLKKMAKLNKIQKGYYNIIVYLFKSYILKMLEFQRLNGNIDEAYYNLLKLFAYSNPSKFGERKIKKDISDTLDYYFELTDNLYNKRNELYGKTTPTEVSFSSREGKAILVSGTDLKKLELVLRSTKNKKIDVYTHGYEMLLAHSYDGFKKYKNLVGHFGLGLETSITDFATFPGAILMTRGSLQRIDDLCRGRLFTLDPLASKGVTHIENNDFTKLIESSQEAKGFKRDHIRESLTVGYCEDEIFKKFDGIIDRLINKDIRHLYLVGAINYKQEPDKYFKEFFEYLPEDCFAISFAFDVKKENVYHIDTFYDYSLIHKLVNRFIHKCNMSNPKISAFLTNFDKQFILNVLMLKHLGIKNIYIEKEIPTTLAIPQIKDILISEFGVKQTTQAELDIENTLNS